MNFIVVGILMSGLPFAIAILRYILADKRSILVLFRDILIALVIGFGLTFLIFLDAWGNETTWNNGFCSCGGEWDLISITRSKNGSNHFYYECVDCKDLIDLTRHFQK